MGFLNSKIGQSFLQFVRFGIVGLSNTAIGYLIYVVALFFMQRMGLFPNTDYLAAQVISFFMSVLWSFYWNRRFVFRAENTVPWQKALLKAYCSYAFTGLFLNSLLSVIWVQVLHINKLAAPILNLGFSVPINFLLNKYWTFNNNEGSDEKNT